MPKSNFMRDQVNNRVDLVMGERKPLANFNGLGMGGLFAAVAIVFAHALMGVL